MAVTRLALAAALLTLVAAAAAAGAAPGRRTLRRQVSVRAWGWASLSC